eukprot:339463-Amorphochlora_amoeboformis.AAC.1
MRKPTLKSTWATETAVKNPPKFSNTIQSPTIKSTVDSVKPVMKKATVKSLPRAKVHVARTAKARSTPIIKQPTDIKSMPTSRAKSVKPQLAASKGTKSKETRRPLSKAAAPVRANAFAKADAQDNTAARAKAKATIKANGPNGIAKPVSKTCIPVKDKLLIKGSKPEAKLKLSVRATKPPVKSTMTSSQAKFALGTERSTAKRRVRYLPM